MYCPAAFAESDVTVLHEFIRVHPLGALVTLTANGLDASHIPLLVSPEPAPYGTLRGHVARANPIWRDQLDAARCLVIFQGPNSYISPTWYPSKAESGKVVPTWNYVAVHAHGFVKVHDDPRWTTTHLAELTATQEAGRSPRWHITDAPADYVETMARGVVGIEIRIEQLVGKWKMSQNRSAADRAGVVDSLAREGTAASEATSEIMRSIENRKPAS